MNSSRKDEVFKELFDSCIALQKSKSADYASDSDELENFKGMDGKLIGITPFQKWAIYFGKHAFSILNAIGKNPNMPSTDSEPIEGRIQDAINYLGLLKCLIVDANSDSLNVRTIEDRYDSLVNHVNHLADVSGDFLMQVYGEIGDGPLSKDQLDFIETNYQQGIKNEFLEISQMIANERETLSSASSVVVDQSIISNELPISKVSNDSTALRGECFDLRIIDGSWRLHWNSKRSTSRNASDVRFSPGRLIWLSAEDDTYNKFPFVVVSILSDNIHIISPSTSDIPVAWSSGYFVGNVELNYDNLDGKVVFIR